MASQILASIIDSLLMSAAGVLVTLLGYGVIGRKPRDMLEEEKQRTSRQFCRVGGPLLIAIGVILALFRLASWSPK